MPKKWNVYVTRDDRVQYIGEVHESNEALARCAALSRFGVTEEEVESGEALSISGVIYPNEVFEVTPG